MRLHQVQISIARDGEDDARRFYGEALGLQEVSKPPSLTGRGGCWFRAFDGDVITAELHLGVEEPFRPAEKAHPGLVLDTLDELEATAARIEHAGYELSWAERDTFEGYVRFHARDGFGNRVEVMTPAA
ncbi:VOC family protein [Brachybacterium paraconglomeratum]|uniref:VOC family protein n=1 Tax=Brachybacterium paraconglomeratum TaxID=173362 RepID=UPI00223BFC8F|nr:VOC family protein [Brachybacterium paraconglomeratum]MCT1436061.1 VOC family protein [Brachybacterium paraconglomeratum]